MKQNKRKYFLFSKGTPFPLGCNWINENTLNFSLFAPQPKNVFLKLYHKKKCIISVKLDPKVNKTGDIWHIRISNINYNDNLEYLYFLDSHPFLEDKKSYFPIIDPYSKNLSGGRRWGEYTEFKIANKRFTQRKSIILPYTFNYKWENDNLLNIPLEDTIIYELHVRGYTKHPSSHANYPGTYRGLVEKIPYLKELGITTVELMPICEFDENDIDKINPITREKLKNFWGYNTICFFMPKSSYAYNNKNNSHIKEFKDMIKSFHKAKIEVIIDIVFNHTAEGNEKGPTLHFKGMSNDIFYMHPFNNKLKYLNFSGCGNTLNTNNAVVSDFIIECLRYWVLEMHVDGFRFDLASVFNRDKEGNNIYPHSNLLQRISEDPILTHIKLIAEPWDIGLYQLGTFSQYGNNWSEWNGKFRDDIRSFIKSDNGFVINLSNRLLGSPDIFKSPLNSINYITSHDGFTLNDLVSYNKKHNIMNGENNKDGMDDNRSWNCGVEGPTSDLKIEKLRKRQIKNFLCILFLSQGIPMLLGGDEFRRTQQGNNNAYCQDNEISWVNWDLLKKNKDIFRFTKEIIKFRKRYRIFRSNKFLDASFFEWHGVNLYEPDWSYYSHSIALLLKGSKLGERDIYIIINSYWDKLKFALPSNKKWKRIIDTYEESPNDILDEKKLEEINKDNYIVKERSIVVLIS